MRKIIILFLCMNVFVGNTLSIFAENISTVKNKKITVDNEIKNISKAKAEEQKKLQEEKKNVASLKSEESEIEKQINKLIEDENFHVNEIKTIDDGIKDSQLLYEEALKLFKTRLRAIYMTADDTILTMLLSSDDLTSFYEKYEIMDNISKKNKEIIDEFIEAKEDLEYKKENLEASKAKIQSRISDSRRAREVLKTSRSEKEDRIRLINDKIIQLKNEEDELLEESNKLAQKIKLLNSSGGKYSGGIMTWPVPSCTSISSYYGVRMHPVLKYKRMHTGIDIPAERGVSIIASSDGIVRATGWEGGYGRTVIVDHGGGVMTLYAHTSLILVEEGQKVRAGETIAKVGTTGLSTGPHLHFEVRVNGDTVDPLTYFKSK